MGLHHITLFFLKHRLSIPWLSVHALTVIYSTEEGESTGLSQVEEYDNDIRLLQFRWESKAEQGQLCKRHCRHQVKAVLPSYRRGDCERQLNTYVCCVPSTLRSSWDQTAIALGPSTQIGSKRVLIPILPAYSICCRSHSAGSRQLNIPAPTLSQKAAKIHCRSQTDGPGF